MSFQTRDLWMLALGLPGDLPSSGLQPALPGGMHLRWAFHPARGFPWYGYYLFRRPSTRREKPVCVGEAWSKGGVTGSAGVIATGFGTLASDRRFTFTEDFPPAGSREIDLDLRQYVRYRAPAGEVLRSAVALVGVRGTATGAGSRPAAPLAAPVTIRVLARWAGQRVASTQVIAAPGAIEQVQIAADAFDEIEISRAFASLIDLCVVPAGAGLAQGWQALDGFPYPLCLPVGHADYPCAGKPASAAAAETTALSRIAYGVPAAWGGAPFGLLHARLQRLVVGGPPPGGLPMHARFEKVAGTPAPPPGAGGSIAQQRQRPLDLLLLGSLQPPVAQMLGLYWLDKSALPGAAYDYLLLADHDGRLGGAVAKALAWMSAGPDFSVVDGVAIFGKTLAPVAPLAAPGGARAWSLPGTTVLPSNGGALIDATNNAGLTFDRGLVDDVLEAGAPVMYHVWRASLGDTALPASPAPADFQVLTAGAPLPVGRTLLAPPRTPPHPAGWPPFGLQYIDRALKDGWYAYTVSAVDIFGRHSAQGAPAAWCQWAPAPDPVPWYYVNPPMERVLHGTAIRLLDKLAPPPPAAEAFALDPEDPNVLHDAAWQAWFNSLDAVEKTSVTGLRVRWQWSPAQQRQAPDTREFRIYYHPAPLNTLRGRVTAILPATATETEVLTDIPNTLAADAHAGLAVRIGADSFRVVASLAGAPLRLRVRNLGPLRDRLPAARSRCALALPPGHPLYVDFSHAAAWQDRLLAVPYGKHVVVDGDGTRRYQVFLPVPASANRAGLPLATPLDEPIAYAAIGVTACDDKDHTPDARGDPERLGNESLLGGPATVWRVRRAKPPPPAMPGDGALRYASPADYHGRSYFTCRWLPAPYLKVLVYRALDDALLQADLARRPRTPLMTTDPGVFPDQDAEPGWNDLRRHQVMAELNALNKLDKTDLAAARAAYHSLSDDGWRILAGLPGMEQVFVQLTPQALDPDEPEAGAPDGLRWRRIGPDRVAGPLPAGQRAFVDTLDGHAANRYFYRCAAVDEAYNVGALSLSSPPVWLPDVTPPAVPKIARIAAGERQVTLEWTSNREPDLAEYRVYRTSAAGAERDIRLMELVHTEAVAVGDPADRPERLAWVDAPVPGLRDLWYRIVAVDRVSADPQGGGGNVSAPSPAMRARAWDLTPPDPPVIDKINWVWVDPSGGVHAWNKGVPQDESWLPSVLLRWNAAAADVRLLVEVHSDSDAGFNRASAWLAPGTTRYLHRNTSTFEAHTYRLKAVSGAGNASVAYHPVILAAVH
jgi:hypothetical protein